MNCDLVTRYLINSFWYACWLHLLVLITLAPLNHQPSFKQMNINQQGHHLFL